MDAGWWEFVALGPIPALVADTLPPEPASPRARRGHVAFAVTAALVHLCGARARSDVTGLATISQGAETQALLWVTFSVAAAVLGAFSARRGHNVGGIAVHARVAIWR